MILKTQFLCFVGRKPLSLNVEEKDGDGFSVFFGTSLGYLNKNGIQAVNGIIPIKKNFVLLLTSSTRNMDFNNR